MTLELKTFASQVRVIDGAWGTELQSLGLPAGAAPELWNLENPSAIEQVARSYVEAGSDIILTNTFGANRLVLTGHDAGDRTTELAEAGTAISRAAADRQAKVFASIGPTGKIIMMGEVDRDEICRAFAEAAGAVARGGADAIVLETFNELDEVLLALAAVKQASPLPVVVSMTFASGPEGTSTMMGNRPAEIAAAAEAGGADAIGANCGAGPADYVKVARLFREATELPIWIKPNAGLPEVGPGGKTVFPLGAEQFASFAGQLAAAGADFIGGCCGTTPQHIRALREAVDAINRDGAR